MSTDMTEANREACDNHEDMPATTVRATHPVCDDCAARFDAHKAEIVGGAA